MSGFTEFILLSPNLAGWSFNAYLDKDGNTRFIKDRVDENGVAQKKRFKFSYNNRVLRIPNAQKETIEFLRNSPDCVDSPNAPRDEAGKVVPSHKFYFKEVNTDRDNAAVVEVETKRIKAQNAALNLEGQDLVDAAVMCGTFDASSNIQRKRVLDYSGSNPDGFMEIINSPIFKTQSLVRRAVNQNVIVQKGFVYMFADLHIGNSEDSAVKFFMEKKNAKVLESLKEKVK